MPLGDSFVRFMNSSYSRYTAPVGSDVKGNRNSLISELSFCLYEYYVVTGINLFDAPVNASKLLELAHQVVQYIARMDPTTPVGSMEDAEIADAKAWARNLDRFKRYVSPEQQVAMRPAFDGCGIVEPCYGDMLIGTTLWELKNVERDFRVADIRQLLTYCALNYASQQYEIESVGLVNAKHGVYFKLSITSLALMASAMTEGELLAEIVRYITMDAPSR